MATQWLRRAGWLAAGASALLLAACGGGSVESKFSPGRVVAFGDAMADVGQNGTRYTVNDGTINVWSHYLANDFGLTLAPSSGGGFGYATGNARVAAEPDAGGGTATATLRQQVGAFLAAGGPGAGDLVIVSAGTSDLIVQAQAVIAGAQTVDQMVANVRLAADQLAGQVQRLVNAGATHVVVAGPINLGRTPWARQTSQEGLLETASREFNQKLLVEMVDLGDSVLYLDAEREFNIYSSIELKVFGNVTQPVCSSVDAGAGIGTGAGQVDSSECTTATVVDAEYNGYLYADRVYPTPRGHQLFGDYAQSRIRERW